MIIDGPITFDLTLGADRRIPQPEDARLVVPPIMTPVVLSLKPTRIQDAFAGQITDSSLLTDFFVSRLNQVGTTFSIANLVPGLWEIELTMASFFDYTPAPPLVIGSPLRVIIFTATETVIVLARFPTAGSFTDFNRLRILTPVNVTVGCSVPTTGATDDLSVYVTLNAIRIL